MALENLKLLKEDMRLNNWSICSFVFHYKGVEYIVLVKRFVGTIKRKSEFALVRLEFMKANDLDDNLDIEANAARLLVNEDDLRRYFGIEKTNNSGDIMAQFAEQFGRVIPTEMPKNNSKIEKQAMVRSLSISDSEDPSKIYCYQVKRNPQGNHRSMFNSDKTKLLRNNLYEKFKNDDSISFCYSSDESKENDDTTIIINFSSKLV